MQRGITRPGFDPVPTLSGPIHNRLRIALALAIVTPLGFATKFWLPRWLPAPLGKWCLLYGGAVLYEVFWILVLTWIWPRRDVRGIAGVVLLATCAIELLQRLHTPWLDDVRGSFVGAMLLGNGFDWWDFPHYVIGCVIGMCVATALRGGRRRSDR